MRTRSLILLVLLVTLTGCVVTYGGFPNPRMESLPKDHEPKPLSYRVEPFISSPQEPYLSFIMPSWYPLMMIDFREKGLSEVRHTLETSGMFSELIIEDESLPYKGMYVNISYGVRQPSLGATSVGLGQGVLCILPPLCILAAVGAVPYYSGEGGLYVTYMLYGDETHKKTYQYTIKKKGVGGILFLPFAWLNFFTDDLKDALRGTTLQFLIDAQREGCFVGSPNCLYYEVAPRAVRTSPQPEERGGAGRGIENSLQPNLKWEAFPGLGEDVTYDLKVWHAKTGLNQVQHGSVVYEREGITQPFHQIEVPLELSTHYLWAVRAHFKRNDQIQVTPWSHEIAADALEEPRYYHLWTPTSLDLPQ